MFTDFNTKNPLDFPDYEKKINKSRYESSENEAVICGTCEINGEKTAIFVMDPYFMMGSMGSVVGEKVTSIFEYATENSLPV
jgi:acetyl-CoA carboxylase carboxyl transferase subunit beta